MGPQKVHAPSLLKSGTDEGCIIVPALAFLGLATPIIDHAIIDTPTQHCALEVAPRAARCRQVRQACNARQSLLMQVEEAARGTWSSAAEKLLSWYSSGTVCIAGMLL